MISFSFSLFFSSKPIVTFAIREKFFTIPIFWPSGVYDGQIIPKCVLWSKRGFADFELAWIGATTLLKWDSVAKKLVSLFRTWATPDRMTYPMLDLPQFPVANEFLMGSVMVLSSKIRSIFYPDKFFLPSLIRFRSKILAPSIKLFLKCSLNCEINRIPVRSNLFLP